MTPRFIPAHEAGGDWYQTVYLKSLRWRLLRWACKRRDGHRCRVCNGTVGLQAHHRTYTHRGRAELRYLFSGFRRELDDLTLLCNECHERAPRP